MRPMLATPGEPPDSPDWVHEVKWDGMRVLADVREGRVRLFSRNERDVSVTFPELADLGDTLQDALLDGEIILLQEGIPSLAALMERMHVTDPRRAQQLAQRLPVTVMTFDLLRLYGVDLLRRPHSQRRASLDKLELPESHWQRSPLYDDGKALFSATREQGLEGVVSKRRGSLYLPGRRSADWRKAPHHLNQSCVVGGWRGESGDDRHLGALLLGIPDADGALRYVGRVGSGLTRSTSADLQRELTAVARGSSPFEGEVPALDAAGARWCEPQVVVEVRHLGWTNAGRLRQGVFRAVRADLEAEQVRIE